MAPSPSPYVAYCCSCCHGATIASCLLRLALLCRCAPHCRGTKPLPPSSPCCRVCQQVPLYVTSVLVVASQQPLLPPSVPGAAAARLFAAQAPPGAGKPPYNGSSWRIVYHADRWHNIPVVWPVLRRTACRLVDVLLIVLGF